MATIARKITVKQGTRRSTTPLAATVALALATVGLAACSQPAVLEQTPVVRSEHLVPRDTVLVATSDPMIVLTETDAVQAMSTDGAAITRISIKSPSGQNRVYGPMYASAAGSAGGRITQGVTDQDGAWSDDIAWGYGDLAEWQAQTAAASAKDEEGEADAPMSPQCAELARNADADLGAVLKAGCEPTLAQMSALMDNPLGNVAMWFNQYDFYKLENASNGKTADKHNYMGIIQFPKGLNEDWNLINRFVYNVPSMPIDSGKFDNFGSVPGGGGGALPPAGAAPIDFFGGRTTGFGDIYYVGLVAPKKPIKLESGANLLWGAGLDFGFPTASDDLLGTGKYLAGPTALGVYMGPKWKIGALVQHYWDYAGDDDRDDVNLTNLQIFYYYSLNETTSIGAGPNIIANWEQDSDNAFTVPVGIGINKTFQFGKIPVRIGGEFFYSVIRPDTVGTEWSFRFYVIPAVASALFDWMQ
jgi:hypothetical protein